MQNTLVCVAVVFIIACLAGWPYLRSYLHLGGDMSTATTDDAGQAVVKKAEPTKSPVGVPIRAQAGQSGDIPPFLQYILLYVGIIITAYVIAVHNPTSIRIVGPRPSRASCDEGSWSLANLNTTAVPRYAWEPSLPFAAQLAGWREPVILTGTFVTKWKAIERWSSDEYLRSKEELSRMQETMVVNSCQMNPANQANALARDGLIKAEENFYSLNATSETFFSRYNEPNEDAYWYWYGKVENSLVKDVEPSEGLWVDAQDQEQFGLYMWLSGPDIGPWWHYDQDHNFYVQVSGTKRFILVPPWETPNMHVYPQIHPRNHKSQVDFDKPNLSATPNYANVSGALLAELQPGEVLYIPPYWWHHVRSHVRSVSLASWSQSGIFRSMRFGLYKRNFAFDSLPPHSPTRRAAFRFLLLQIAHLLYGPSLSPTSPSSDRNHQNFFHSLVSQRWEPLRAEIEASSLPLLSPSLFLTPISTDTSSPSPPPKFDLSALCGPNPDQLEPHLKVKLLDDAKAAADAFENCQTKVASGNKGIGKDRRDMQAIRDIEFSDFTEFFLANEIGSAQVLPFLDHCLHQMVDT